MTAQAQARQSVDRSSQPFQIRGGGYTLLVLRLNDPKDPVLFQSLADKIAQAPNFFRNAPVVIDLQALADAPPFNMAELGRRLRQHQLVPIGVQNGTEEQNRAAVNAGFSIFPEGRNASLRDRPADAVGPASATAEPTPAPAREAAGQGGPGRLVTQPVRSGRRIHVDKGDLVVLASISPGAEVVADGHIHVYGALRGRALAGVTGDTTARIFCRSLEAELVSIAGYWRVREDIPDALIGRPAQVYLEGERIVVEPLG